jgi:hypothetical protein
MRIFVQDQGLCKKYPQAYGLLFRGLFFEHNADIGQKDHLGTGTNSKLKRRNRDT